MTPLRRRMTDDLILHNLSPKTGPAHIEVVDQPQLTETRTPNLGEIAHSGFRNC